MNTDLFLAKRMIQNAETLTDVELSAGVQKLTDLMGANLPIGPDDMRVLREGTITLRREMEDRLNPSGPPDALDQYNLSEFSSLSDAQLQGEITEFMEQSKARWSDGTFNSPEGRSGTERLKRLQLERGRRGASELGFDALRDDSPESLRDAYTENQNPMDRML